MGSCTPTSLITSGALETFFEANGGGTASGLFGCYALAADGATLYLALGNDPGNEDGALVVSTPDGSALTAETVPTEQGLHDIAVMDGKAFVAGTDPTEAGWALGNLYYKSNASWTKRRTLTNVIHTLGLWYDGSTLYAATGAHTGDDATWRAYVFTSADLGATWAAPVEVGTGSYRVYDIIGHGARLYATVKPISGANRLYYSADNGATWTQVSGVAPDTDARLVLWSTDLIVLKTGRTAVYKIDASYAMTEHALGFTVSSSAKCNPLAVADGSLYTVATATVSGCPDTVYATADLATWAAFANVPGTVLALADWASAGVLLATVRGTGEIYQMEY